MSEVGTAARTEFLYWDCTTAPGAKKDVRESMHANLGALANRYRRSGFMPGYDTPEHMLDGVFALLLPERRPVDFLVSATSLACSIRLDHNYERWRSSDSSILLYRHPVSGQVKAQSELHNCNSQICAEAGTRAGPGTRK